jgi:hypothetical protein
MTEVKKGIAIDKGVPMRKVRRYPWAGLEVGDSFFIENSGGDDSNLRALAKRHGYKVSIRREQGGVRVWRVS